MAAELLYDLELWLILGASLVIFIAATEAGFRLGLRSRARVSADAKSELGTLQGAVLGLLALLLGFTFSMAITRFEARKQLVLKEANAIGTAFLRTQTLPEPQQGELAGLLRRYVQARLDFFNAEFDSPALRQARQETEQTQNQLWSSAAALAARDPRAITTGLFLQSLNDVIDLHGETMQALENHVPEIIIFLLYFLAVIATGLIGYGSGVSGRRNFYVTLATAVLIAAVILVILDLDRPRRGLIKVSTQRLVELKAGMAGP